MRRRLTPAAGLKTLLVLALATPVFVALSHPARAQLLEQYSRSGIPGFGEEGGLPVLARSRPLYEPPPLVIDGYNVRAALDQSIAHDSNVDGQPNGPGSWVIGTAPSIEVDRVGTRNRLSAALSVDDERYLDLPAQSRTNFAVALGGQTVLGRGTASLGYTHLDEHEITTALATVVSTTAIPVKVDDVRAGYSIDVGRFSFSPGVEDQRFRYGSGTALGARVDESVLDRNDFTAGLTTRYGADASRGLLVVVQDVESDYRRPPIGLPDNSARSLIGLAGIDYQANGLFRYRALAGFERRTFLASSTPATTTPILEANVIYVPTGLTTITVTATRRIEDATSANVGSYVYSHARLVVDHELRRNILLQARTDIEFAEYALGGTQSRIGVGGEVTWLIGPRVRLSADYSFSHQGALSGAATIGPVGAAGLVSQQYDRNLATLTLHLAL